jgi:vacuolar protein sorting-associated protein 13D
VKFCMKMLYKIFLKSFRHRQQRPGVDLEYDSFLKLEMSSVLYVHTQRFVAEIHAFYEHFSQLQSVVSSIHSAAAGIVVC